MNMFDAALVFKTIVEQGSMVKASEALKLSPSVVSKKLTFLEGMLGVQLLRRTTRNIELTESGAVFFERFSTISQSWGSAIDEVTSLNGAPKGTIKMSSPHPLCSRLIVPKLYKFQEKYPGIRFDLIHTSYEDLPNARADITICRKLEDLNSASFIGVSLFEYENSLFASPRYLEKEADIVSISDLQEHRAIVYSPGEPQYEWEFSDQKKVRIDPYIISDSTENVIASASNGLGIAYIPELLLKNEISLNLLQKVLPDQKSKIYETYLYYQKMSFTPQKIRLFIDFLKQSF